MIDFGTMLVGFGAITLSALGTRFGYYFARMSEQADAIGGTTPVSEVEPADWKVATTRLGFAVLGAVGVLMIVFAVWS